MAVRKTSIKRGAVKKMRATAKEEVPSSSSTKELTSSIKRSNKSLLIGIGVVALLIGLGYYFRGLFVVALVNGEPITRLSLIQELEKQGGKQTLDSLVTKILILQEAKAQNVAVSQKDIDDEIKKIEQNLKKQNQTLDQALSFQGMTRKEFSDQIRFQKLIEKLVSKDLNITVDEIAKYIEQNKENLPENKSESELKSLAKEQLQQQKLNQKFRSWVENLQKKAKINYFIQF